MFGGFGAERRCFALCGLSPERGMVSIGRIDLGPQELCYYDTLPSMHCLSNSRLSWSKTEDDHDKNKMHSGQKIETLNGSFC